MNLLVLMYHRARAGRHGNAPAMLDAHFAHVARHCANVLPGEPLAPGSLSVCLSFDDAYFDFHAVVFPLLKRHRLRALLAVVPSVVCENVSATADERLALDSNDAFAHPAKGGFCTWDELGEMVGDGRVTIAAHGLTHQRLDQPGADLENEVNRPKKILEERLRAPVASFVFPFGRYNGAALRQVKEAYGYAFRIGGAANRSWHQTVLYRVDADRMTSPDSLFAGPRVAGYRARHWWNRLRGR